MEKIYLERLQKLADHLMSGKLGHERFDFDIINDAKGPRCGTAGCAIGECPIVWPDEWRWDWAGKPLYGTHMGAFSSAEEFFGLNDPEVEHLFIPDSQRPKTFGGNPLGINATREEVAQNLYEFIKLKKQV